MLTILLISAALGAPCYSYEDDTTCVADPKCFWFVEEEDCFAHNCDTRRLKTLCETSRECQWKDGTCSPVECYRHSGNTCPTDKGCQKFERSEDEAVCLPSGLTPTQGDECTEYGNRIQCIYQHGCEWKSNKCAYDGCYARVEDEADCDTTKCQLVDESEEGRTIFYCYSQNYDPDNRFCYQYAAGVECDSSLYCMTFDNKCKSDPCMTDRNEADCKGDKDCVWGMPELLKDFGPEKEICYYKDRTFGDAALDVFPVLIQCKIFQFVSALLLFVLI